MHEKIHKHTNIHACTDAHMRCLVLCSVALLCVALGCAALRSAAQRCAALLHCVPLRCVGVLYCCIAVDTCCVDVYFDGTRSLQSLNQQPRQALQSDLVGAVLRLTTEVKKQAGSAGVVYVTVDSATQSGIFSVDP